VNVTNLHVARRFLHTSQRALNTISEKPPPDGSGISYSSLTIGVPRELFPNERRVAITPQNAALLRKKGFANVLVERASGIEAQFLDEHYAAAGANLVSQEELYRTTDIMLKVRPPMVGKEIDYLKEGSTIISFLHPAQHQTAVDMLASRKVNAFAVSHAIIRF
jgi:NAD(P) transhydrogenase